MSDENIIDAEFEEAAPVSDYQQNDRTKVLIIGKGYVGSTLGNFLSIDEENIEVHTITREQVNYLDRDELATFFANYEEQGVVFDHVVNCVGFTGENNVDDVADDIELAYILNTGFPVTLGSIAQEFKIPSIINIGTGCIYDGYKEDGEGYKETDIPNFGISDESSLYSKTKHLSEIISTNGFGNVYSLRLRMPLCEIPSENGNRNLFEKLLKYKKLLNTKNSVTYLYDLHNVIYNIIISNEIPYGVYNVVSDGEFSPEVMLEVIKEHKEQLLEAKLVEEDYFDSVELISLEEFNNQKLTKEPRSNTILNNDLVKDVIGIEFVTIDKEWLTDIFGKFIENAKLNVPETAEE
jgi:dTDP-4-dehydrorhamnose reductase